MIARVPVLQTRFGLSDGQLTLILGAVPIVAGVGSVLAGVLAPRLGSGTVLAHRRARAWPPRPPPTGWSTGSRSCTWRSRFFGLFLGAVDATMNMQGVAVQRRYGRSILASCHAWWSVAAIAGSAAAIATAHFSRAYSLGGFLAGIAVVGALTSLLAGPRLLKRAEEAENPLTAAVETAEDTQGPSGINVRRTVALVGHRR